MERILESCQDELVFNLDPDYVASHPEGKQIFYTLRGGRFRQRPLNAHLQSNLEWRSQK